MTLNRQQDGSFKAEAAPGNVFTQQSQHSPYNGFGDDTKLLGYELLIIDPARQQVPLLSETGEFIAAPPA